MMTKQLFADRRPVTLPRIACGMAVLTVLAGAVRPDAGRDLARAREGVPVLAQAADDRTAPPPPAEAETPTPEQKRKTRSAAVLLSVLAGIALTGLLLLIVAISVRGLLRKLAGPTQIDREPQDLLPDAAADDDSRGPEAEDDGAGAAADETQYT
jgi:hypothetical protein